MGRVTIPVSGEKIKSVDFGIALRNDYVSQTDTAAQVLGAGESTHDHVFEKSCSWLVRLNGSNIEVLYGSGSNQAGKLVTLTGDVTDAYNVFPQIEALASANQTIGVKHGDYTFSAQWSPSKVLRIIGEGAGTRFLPSGAFDAIGLTNLKLQNILWRDADAVDHDQSFEKNVIDALFDYKGFFWDFTPQSGDSLTDGVGFEQDGATASLTHLNGESMLATGAAINEARLWMSCPLATRVKGAMMPLNFSYNSRFKTMGECDQIADVERLWATSIAVAGNDHYGFKNVNNEIFGICSDNVDQSITAALATIAATPYIALLEARFFVGKRVDFYIDDVYKASLTTHLPRATVDITYLIYMAVKATAVANKTVWLGNWKYQQYP